MESGCAGPSLPSLFDNCVSPQHARHARARDAPTISFSLSSSRVQRNAAAVKGVTESNAFQAIEGYAPRGMKRSGNCAFEKCSQDAKPATKLADQKVDPLNVISSEFSRVKEGLTEKLSDDAAPPPAPVNVSPPPPPPVEVAAPLPPPPAEVAALPEMPPPPPPLPVSRDEDTESALSAIEAKIAALKAEIEAKGL